jgi:hypothetical protein
MQQLVTIQIFSFVVVDMIGGFQELLDGLPLHCEGLGVVGSTSSGYLSWAAATSF